MSEYIHFSWHASTPPYGQETGGWREVTHTSKDKPFSISESRESLLAMPSGQLTTNRAQRRLAFYAEVRRKKTRSRRLD